MRQTEARAHVNGEISRPNRSLNRRPAVALVYVAVQLVLLHKQRSTQRIHLSEQRLQNRLARHI